MSEDRAADFYAKMSKPEPPQAESVVTAGRGALDRVQVSDANSSAKTASRDVEAPDEPAERTIAEIDEQRRQEESDRAGRMYDLPMSDDGPRFDEPDLDHRFEVEIPDDLAGNLQPGEQTQIGEALAAAGLGLTTAASFIRQGIAASRNGPLSDHEIQKRNTDGLKVLEQRYGGQAGAKIELARGMIREGEAKWPGLTNYLNATGLGSDPKLIQQLVARAERRPGRRG
jgi:hypothetical protein